MKISLNWIFDHINGDVHCVNVAQLVNDFIKTTAEIEEWHKTSLDVDNLTLVEVTKLSNEVVVAYSPEFKKDYNFSFRADACVGSWYLAEIKDDYAKWAKTSSLGGTKDTLLPSFSVEESLRSGGWKKKVELSDYVIDIDNKSINHRPDLWGHRGIAREVAAILDMSLKPFETFISQQIDTNVTHSLQGKTGDFSVAVDDNNDLCKRFAALSIESVRAQPSDLDMVIRLSRLDSKAIDFIVDCTNYVMLDLGQPMHAFDAELLTEKNITVRRACDKEKLTLLDGEVVELLSQDIVIADGSKAVSLIGIMGGASTGINVKTKSLLLEVAGLDAATIRRTAARYKKRTEASMRFEKSLDPNHIEDAILRFLFLLDKHGIVYKASNRLVVLGKTYPILTIKIAHTKIEQLLGISVSVDKVQTILEKLSFGVTVTADSDCFYDVTVPSFRATKDIKIAEDIIEEIGRYIGYDSIPYVMPSVRLSPSDLSKTYATRTIKRLLSNALLMRELYGYSFFDESFLREMSWDPGICVEIKNPISENYIRLVTTLQPHLLKAIKENSIHHPQLRFYEWGRVWRNDNNNVIEKKSVSGIFFDQNKTLDFYEGKSLISRLFKELHCDVLWKPVDDNQYPWLSRYQSASIVHNNICLGVAGMVEESVVNTLSVAGGSAFMFELDADYLINYKSPVTRFVPLSKYPVVRRDVSMMVPLSVIVEKIVDQIKELDTRIRNVSLIDFFIKDEWGNQKSLTFHIEMRDDQKTLENDDVEEMWNKIIAALELQGAVIR